MKTFIAMTLLTASMVSASALANEVRQPETQADQIYKVSPQTYSHYVSFRGEVRLAQQELALKLWQSNRELAQSDIVTVGERAEQQYRVAQAKPVAGGKLINGASQK